MPARLFASMATHKFTTLLVLLMVTAVHAEDKTVSVNSVAAKNFAAKIQPILSNTCAECHARADHGSKFLLKKYDPNFNDPKLAEANLKAFSVWLDTKQPANSPALQYAVKAHGRSKAPPLRDENHPAYSVLELWLHTAASTEGTAMLASVPSLKKSLTTPNTIQLVSASEVATPLTKEPPTLPVLKATPLKKMDEFDPVHFNRPNEPKRK